MPYRKKSAVRATNARSASAMALAEKQETVIPVLQEEMQVSRRTVDTGAVRVRKVVHERQELVEGLYHEHVEVERVAIDEVTEPVDTDSEDDTVVVPVLEEVLVVEKRLLLKEEVRLMRRRQARKEPQYVTLRSEQAIVERRDSGNGEWYVID